MSTKDKLKQAKLPERTVELCLRGDLQAEYEEKDRQLAAAVERSSDGRLVGNPEARRLQDDMELLQMEMREAVLVVRMRAFKRGRYRAMMADHPEVAGDEEKLGYNPETFFLAAIRAAIIEPDDLDDEAFDLLLDSITDQQYNMLAATVQALNAKPVSIPFSLVASRLTRGSDSE